MTKNVNSIWQTSIDECKEMLDQIKDDIDEGEIVAVVTTIVKKEENKPRTILYVCNPHNHPWVTPPFIVGLFEYSKDIYKEIDAD